MPAFLNFPSGRVWPLHALTVEIMTARSGQWIWISGWFKRLKKKLKYGCQLKKKIESIRGF